jgi:hypothetical protein
MSVCPGFYFRLHYFILFLPAVALLTGIGAESIYTLFMHNKSPLKINLIPILLTLVAFFYAVYQQRNLFFFLKPESISRMAYGQNPFIESVEIARYIRENSSVDDTIAILGSEPQIYFYAKRRSATSHITVYPLMAKHELAMKMQEEMISEIESAKPKFLILTTITPSWLRTPESKTRIFDWYGLYQKKYYDTVGIVDILFPQPTVYLWDKDSVGYLPKSKYRIFISKRKD